MDFEASVPETDDFAVRDLGFGGSDVRGFEDSGVRGLGDSSAHGAAHLMRFAVFPKCSEARGWNDRRSPFLGAEKPAVDSSERFGR